MASNNSVPKVKASNFLLKSMLTFGDDPIGFSENNRDEHGDIFDMNFPLMNFYAVNHCRLVQHVLVGNQKNYTKGMSYDFLKLAIGNGLITNEGESWMHQRRLSQPAFHKKSIEKFIGVINQNTEGLMSELKTLSDNNEVTDILTRMNDITLDIISKIIFSNVLGEDREKILNTVNVGNHYISYRLQNLLHPPLWVPTSSNLRFKKALKQGDEVIYKLIEQRRKDPNSQHDLLDMLLKATDEDTGESMDDQQLRDELLTLLVAGFETSANALTWGIWELFKHPKIVGKLRQELDEIPDLKALSFQELLSLPYTNMVINEFLRMYPPVWGISRCAKEDDELGGYPIKKGTQILFHIYSIQRNPDYWENPNDFDPERFNPENAKKIPKHAFMPFGAGPRFCIGSNLAMLEMIIILSNLVKNFDFEVIDDQKIEFEALVTLRPKFGIKTRVKVRS